MNHCVIIISGILGLQNLLVIVSVHTREIKMKKIISSTEYNELLSFNNMEKMEKYSSEAARYLKETNEIMLSSDIRNNLPWYVREIIEPYSIVLKYPTYRIEVVDNISFDFLSDIENILNKFKYDITWYEDNCCINCLINGNDIIKVKSVGIVCLCETLYKNTKMKDKIETIMKNKKYYVNIYPNFRYYSIPIEFLDKDKKELKVIHK